MTDNISDAELTRVLRQRVKQAQEELYLGFDASQKALARKEAIIYVRELLAEIMADFDKE